jgi:peptide deformylase
MYAFAIQHEIDHLDGKVFVDGSSTLKKAMIKSKMKRAARNK